MGKVDAEGGDEDATTKKWIVHVDDRLFNDLRYPLETEKMTKLGWKEEMDWEDGLKQTVDWYRTNSGNWGDIESALVAHPRRGLDSFEVAPKLASEPCMPAEASSGSAATGGGVGGDGK